MAMVSITIENGANSASLVKESDNDSIREAIVNLMNLILVVEHYSVWIGDPDSQNRIPCIKAIRTVSKLGLREAKLLNDDLSLGGIKNIPGLVIHKDQYSEVYGILSQWFKQVELRPL